MKNCSPLFTSSIQKAVVATLLVLLVSSCAVANKAPLTGNSDVPLMQAEQLSPLYWLSHTRRANDELMSRDDIKRFNANVLNNDPNVIDPLSINESLSAEKLLRAINKASHQPDSPRFYADGTPVTALNWQRYNDSLNRNGITPGNPVEYGLVVKRALLRTYPTDDRVFKKDMDLDLDRFQESGLFPGEPVAILHTSTDKKWYLVQNYHYLAWVKAEAIAIGDKQTITTFLNPTNKIVVTGAKVYTNFVPDQPDISQLQLDMGVRLPLVTLPQEQHQLYGQNPYASYVVKLPVRKANGQLAFKPALIARSQDISKDYLPFTRANIITQAFKFLGERYGWGHGYNARDCTGFVGEIYKSFGIFMPRNSSQQGAGSYGINANFDINSNTAQTNLERNKVVSKLTTGDLIYIPGHVMMFLGDINGQPYVIHDVKGLGYVTNDGDWYRGTLNGVSVTPLLPLSLSPKIRYLDRIYNIKRIRLQGEF